jgi:internalin A
MPAEAVAHPWRKMLRLSVRALVVVVLVIGAGLGWFVRSAHIQRDAVAVIRHAGGTVSYDWEWNHGAPVKAGKPRAPAWLLDMIGVDYFGHVTAVWGPSSMTPADDVMVAAGKLTQLQYLDVDQSYISDAGMAHLAGLTELHDLFVFNGQITDAGLAHLSGLTSLSFLSVRFTRITDAGLEQLEGLTNFERLVLTGTAVTDAGMAHLKGLTKLSGLDLRNTDVSDRAMRDLQAGRPDLDISGMTY